MQERPVDTTPTSVWEHALDIIAIAIPLAGLVLAFVRYPELPEEIPTHFNAKGAADGYGASWNIFLLPAISLVMSAGMAVLARYPHQFNYMSTITAENAPFEYKRARVMIRVLNVMTGILLLSAVWSMLKGTDGAAKLSPWFGVSFIGTILTPVLILIFWKQDKHK
jgi:uncharacterized membrane protein